MHASKPRDTERSWAERAVALAALLSIVGSVSAAPEAAHHELTSADLEVWLDGFMPNALATADVAGAVVVVVKAGSILFKKGYGYSDLAAKVPMDPDDSVFGIESVSKTFTWTAVMQLVEQGKLDLDLNINDYLDFSIPPAFGQPVTMRNLMTHTAGFEERLKSYNTPDSPRDLAAYFPAVPSPERIDPPGHVQAYSNYGSALAGYIVERVSGMPYIEYMDRHVLKPLQMHRSTFSRSLAGRLGGRLVKYYDTASSGNAYPPIGPEEQLTVDPSGSLTGTATDIAQFMLAHLQHGRFRDYELLKPETADYMHAARFWPKVGPYALPLGFFPGHVNNRRIIQHDGDGNGSHTDMQLLLDEGVGLLSFVNSDGTSQGLLSTGYRIRAALFRQFMDRYFPAPPEGDLETSETARQHARLVAGEYEMSRRPSGDFMEALYLLARITVRADEDGSIVTPPLLNFEGNRPQRWREVGHFKWRELNGSADLEMQVEDGVVRSWLPRHLVTFVVVPVPYWRSAALNVPILAASSATVLLATLLWPIAAIVRRRYGATVKLEGRAAIARRLTLSACAATAFYLLGWICLLGSAGFGGFNESLDAGIRVLQVLGVLCVAGTLVALWNVLLTWMARRSLWTRIQSVLLAAALVGVTWFSFAFSLISFSLNY